MRTGSLLLLLIILSGCTILDPNPRATVANASAVDSSARSAKSIYINKCAGCHGLAGKPADTSVTDLRGYAGAFEAFDGALTIGPSGMPQYPELDTTIRHRLYELVRSFPPK